VKRAFVFATTAALALLGAGCPSPSGSLYPTTEGSGWHMSNYVLTGTPDSLDTLSSGTATYTAMGRTTLANGREVTQFQNEVTTRYPANDTTIAETSFSYVGEVGDTIFTYSRQSDTIGQRTMRSTPAVGQSWAVDSSRTATVVSQEDVTVAAGTYRNAWKVKVTTLIGDFYKWYEPGTGLVRTWLDETTAGSRVVVSSELTSATIK
jgi:hypothetical protein